MMADKSGKITQVQIPFGLGDFESSGHGKKVVKTKTLKTEA